MANETVESKFKRIKQEDAETIKKYSENGGMNIGGLGFINKALGGFLVGVSTLS